MERPVLKPIGTPVEDLDTPALVVDADALKANLAKVHDGMSGVEIRPSLNAHLSAEIAAMQIGRGVPGFAASTIAQAEAFAPYVDDGCDILIESVVATPEDAARVARLRRERQIIASVDTPAAIDLLAAAVDAEPSISYIGVAFPIRDDSRSRSIVSRSIGVAPGGVIDIARSLDNSSPPLFFAGVFSAPTLTLGDKDKDEKAALAALADAAGLWHGYGYNGMMFEPFDAARGSALYNEPALDDSATELIAGSYALSDLRLLERRPEIRPAAHILTTVMSERDHGMVWLDAGQKAVGIDTGLPLVDGIPHAAITRMSAEHGCMELAEGARWNVRLGDKIRLIPHDIANAVNVYDYIHVIQDGKLADIWRTVGRGGYA